MSIDGDDNGHAELDTVADVFDQIRQALLHELDVLRDVFPLEGRARRDDWTTAVHLQSAYRRYEDDGVGHKAGFPALDVEELLHADVGAETGLGDDDSLRSDQLQGYRVRENG